MVAKVFLIVLFAGLSAATHLYGIIGESYHAPQPYRFGYHVKDKGGSHHRHEESDGHGNVRGSYGYTDDKGQYREVHYVADKGGFRAEVKTNEQGTANQNPADVHVKADPPQHHEFQHHGLNHHEINHHHVPHHHEFNHHHVPHHQEVKVYHHVPKHHHVEPLNHHHHDFKHHHHVEPLNHHDFKHHHHDFKHHHHDFDFKHHPFSSYAFDNFAPLHGYSYNPSLFHGHGHWPFQESNTYGHWGNKGHHGGYKFVTPHYRGHHHQDGFSSGFSNDFGKDFEGSGSSHKHRYEEILEKIKKMKSEPFGHFEGFKGNEFDLGKDDKGWKYGYDKDF